MTTGRLLSRARGGVWATGRVNRGGSCGALCTCSQRREGAGSSEVLGGPVPTRPLPKTSGPARPFLRSPSRVRQQPGVSHHRGTVTSVLSLHLCNHSAEEGFGSVLEMSKQAAMPPRPAPLQVNDHSEARPFPLWFSNRLTTATRS